MAIPTANLCYGPVDRSYAVGGTAYVPGPTSSETLSLPGGSIITLGIESVVQNGGSGGQAAGYQVYQDGTYLGAGPLINRTTAPQQTNYTLPGTGTHNYRFAIWTDSNAYGLTMSQMWATHANCTGSLVPCFPRLKAGQDTQVIITDTLIAALMVKFGNTFLKALMLNRVGATESIEELCTSTPPYVPPASGDMWATPVTIGSWAGLYVRRAMWWYFCECTPGTGPNLPNPPVITDPGPDWPDDPVYPVNPTNPCLDLTEVRRKLDQLLSITNGDLALDTLVQRYTRPFAVVTGAVHSGLTGSGSFAISRLVGLRIQAVDSSPVRTLEGNPPYLWDIGWASVSDGGAMLQETRITRSSAEWLPTQCQLATTFGYYANPGVTLTVTELQAEP